MILRDVVVEIAMAPLFHPLPAVKAQTRSLIAQAIFYASICLALLAVFLIAVPKIKTYTEL
jgi:hypothetical protein